MLDSTCCGPSHVFKIWFGGWAFPRAGRHMTSETFRFQLGEFSCMAIQDEVGHYPIAMFLQNLAAEVYEPILLAQDQDLHQVGLPYTCLLIETGQNRLLVDTGVGSYGSSTGKLQSLLRRE